jgi:hypothetical protein
LFLYESLLALKLSPEALSAELRMAASMKLYELGRLSPGAAERNTAKICWSSSLVSRSIIRRVAMPKAEELPIFTRWMEFLEWLLPTTEKFPKRVRFTFADRINNLALDIVEDLVEARYSRNKPPLLKRINLRLEKLRILLRLCHRLKYLPHQGYEHAMRALNEVGRMLGGWMKQQADQNK